MPPLPWSCDLPKKIPLGSGHPGIHCAVPGYFKTFTENAMHEKISLFQCKEFFLKALLRLFILYILHELFHVPVYHLVAHHDTLASAVICPIRLVCFLFPFTALFPSLFLSALGLHFPNKISAL